MLVDEPILVEEYVLVEESMLVDDSLLVAESLLARVVGIQAWEAQEEKKGTSRFQDVRRGTGTEERDESLPRRVQGMLAKCEWQLRGYEHRNSKRPGRHSNRRKGRVASKTCARHAGQMRVAATRL